MIKKNTINASINKVWDLGHCRNILQNGVLFRQIGTPYADNDLREGGKFNRQWRQKTEV